MISQVCLANLDSEPRPVYQFLGALKPTWPRSQGEIIPNVAKLAQESA